MNANLHRVRRTPRTMPPLVTEGQAYDLTTVYADLNERFFGGKLKVPITWGRGVGRARRGGLTFGSYDPVLALIRIHPVLDRTEVPRYFLESVVYHEMLHHHMGGVPDSAGRTVYHTRAFREAEARYPRHEDALAWEKANLARLLRASQALDRARKAARRATKKPRRPPGLMFLPHLRRLLPYLGRHRGRLVLGLGCLLATTAASVANPWVLRHAIDDLTIEVTPRKLWLYAGVLLALVAFEGVFRFLMRRVLIGASRTMEYELRNEVFEHLTLLAPRYYQENRIGEVMSRASNDMSAVRSVLGPGIMYTANTIATFAGAVTLMLLHQPAADRARPRPPRPRVVAGAPLRAPGARPLRGGAGPARGDERAGAGEPLRGPGGAGLRPGAPRGGALRRGERGVRRTAAGAWSASPGSSGPGSSSSWASGR